MICTRSLFHYFLHPDPDLARIYTDGLLPLTSRSPRPQDPDEDFYVALYETFARPVLRRDYPGNSGVYFTPIDFRAMGHRGYGTSARFSVPVDRLDPAWSVLTYDDDGVRRSTALTTAALQQVSREWPADRIARRFGVDRTRMFYYVPQVVTYQPEPVPVSANDLDPCTTPQVSR